MLAPELKKFKEVAETKEFKRITVYREIVGDTFTPISLLRNFTASKHVFLLESANLDKTFSRYSFFGKDPERVIKFKKGNVIVEKGGKTEKFQMNPMDYLNGEFQAEAGYNDGTFGDFSGGYVGFFGFESVNYMGVLREQMKEPENEDLLTFFHVNEFYVFDNHLGKLYSAVSVKLSGDAERDYERATDRTEQMATEIFNMNYDGAVSIEEAEAVKEYDQEYFEQKVVDIKQEITDGEAIQVVFSNRYEIPGKLNPLNFYRALRNVNPSPYMFFLKLGDDVLCGSSPEIHLKIRNNEATLKPIAGTYRVGDDIEQIKKDLLADEKEVAEHLMLLDLARNDLYRGCKPESVTVTQEFIPEVYSHVIHIVSTVVGQLRENISPLKMFMETFPAGTVSGAPKVRAMELINQYEESTRGFYAGCVGYFGYSGNIDTCITIRSAMVKQDRLVLRAGAGIVYDSVPESEFKEVGNKLGALFKAYEYMKNMEERNVFNG